MWSKFNVKMKFGIVNFPGSSGFSDMVYAVHYIMGHDVVELWHESSDLQGADIVILPSGSSFGDLPAAGAVAAKSPIISVIKSKIDNSSNLIVLGVGNGFQILCNSGMLKGSLATNLHNSFISKNIFVKPDNTNTALTRMIQKEQILQLPVAHFFGRFIADKDILRELHQNDQILLRYCCDDGKITSEANPDGSIDNIAAICNASKNVFGIMACPERAVDHELGNTDGLVFFQSLINQKPT